MPLIQRSIKNKKVYAIFQNLHKKVTLQNYAQKLNLDWHRLYSRQQTCY